LRLVAGGPSSRLFVAHVERFVIDQKPDQLALGDVDHRLTRKQWKPGS
jgi:hypothetical protein